MQQFVPFTVFLSKFVVVIILVLLLLAILRVIKKDYWHAASFAAMIVGLLLGPTILAMLVNRGLAFIGEGITNLTHRSARMPVLDGVTTLAILAIVWLFFQSSTSRQRPSVNRPKFSTC